MVHNQPPIKGMPNQASATRRGQRNREEGDEPALQVPLQSHPQCSSDCSMVARFPHPSSGC